MLDDADADRRSAQKAVVATVRMRLEPPSEGSETAPICEAFAAADRLHSSASIIRPGRRRAGQPGTGVLNNVGQTLRVR